MFVLWAGTTLEPCVASPLAAGDWCRVEGLYQIDSYSCSFLGTQISVSKEVLHLSWEECSCNMGTRGHSAAACFTMKTGERKKAILQNVRKEVGVNADKWCGRIPRKHRNFTGTCFQHISYYSTKCYQISAPPERNISRFFEMPSWSYDKFVLVSFGALMFLAG